MPIDTSIYGQLQAPQMPDFLGSMGKAMSLKQMQMQNQAQQLAFDQQDAMKQAMAHNVGPDGKLDQAQTLADLYRFNPQAAMQASEHFNKVNKDAAEAGLKQNELGQAGNAQIGALVDHLNGIPFDQAKKIWPTLVQMAVKSNTLPKGVAPDELTKEYLDQVHSQMFGSKPYLDNQKTLAEINKTKAETGEKQINRLTDYQKMAQSDDTIKKPTEMIAMGNDAMAAIKDALQNPQSRGALPIMLARFTTAGQRMNEVEIEKNVANGTFGDKMKQMYLDAKKGILSPEMADYATQFVSSQMASAANNLSSGQGKIANMYAQATGLPLDAAHYKLFSSLPGSTLPTPEGPSRFAKNQKQDASSGPIKSAYADDKPGAGVSAKEKEAVQWAKNNLKDPRAQRILKAHGHM